jgi:hypothetical protein
MQEGEQMEKAKTFEQISKEFMDEWYLVLKEGNPEKMAELYTEPCTFFPTLSDKVITDRVGVRDYFEHFMAMNPSGVSVSKDTGGELAEGVYAIGVKYDFNLPDGSVVHARNTMDLVTRGGKLMIRTHHSSKDPESKKNE